MRLFPKSGAHRRHRLATLPALPRPGRVRLSVPRSAGRSPFVASVVGQSVIDQTVAGQTVAGQTVAGQTVAGPTAVGTVGLGPSPGPQRAVGGAATGAGPGAGRRGLRRRGVGQRPALVDPDEPAQPVDVGLDPGHRAGRPRTGPWPSRPGSSRPRRRRPVWPGRTTGWWSRDRRPTRSCRRRRGRRRQGPPRPGTCRWTRGRWCPDQSSRRSCSVPVR